MKRPAVTFHAESCGCKYCAARRVHRVYELDLAKRVTEELHRTIDERRKYEAVNNPVDD